jgi:hypothetical protein
MAEASWGSKSWEKPIAKTYPPKKTIAIASSALKTRLSIDTDIEIYRALIAQTKIVIPDDDFIVHRGNINNPGPWVGGAGARVGEAGARVGGSGALS